MSPIRFFGSLLVGRLYSRRICAGPARRLIHQSRNLADDVGGSGFSGSLPIGGKICAGIMTAGTLSSALVGGMLYFTEEPPAVGLTNKDAATLEEVIAEEGDATKEAALKPMFEEWMVKYGRRYESEEEKTMRYREFKRHLKNIEKANAVGTGKPCFGLNNLSDSTRAESRIRCGCHEPIPAAEMFMLRCDAMFRGAVARWKQRRGNRGDVE